MIEEVVAIGRELGKPTGTHVMKAEQSAIRLGQGMQFIAVASDLGMLAYQAQAIVQGLGLKADLDLARY